MDTAVIVIILATAGVVSVLLFVTKGLLDQVPEVIDSASRARAAWHRFRRPVPDTDDEDPHLAA